MDRLIKLATGLIRRYPQRAVAILQQQPVSEVIELMDSLPESFSLQLLNASPYPFSADILTSMQEEQCIDLLSAMPASTVANILRLVKSSNRERIIAGLPLVLRTSIQLLLKFDETTVGAWMSLRFVAVPVDTSIAETREIIRGAGREMSEAVIYALDGQSRLLGQIHLMALLNCDDDSSVKNIVTPCQSLPASMSLDNALESPLWESQDECPVLDHKKNLVGVIRYATLRQALFSPASSTSPLPNQPGVDVVLILHTYISSLLGLLSPLERVRLSSPKRDK